MELTMRFARLAGLREEAVSTTVRTAPRRHRYSIEYGLVLVILCFASISTFNAITAKHSSSSSDKVSVSYQ
jgi:hypothetical protein